MGMLPWHAWRTSRVLCHDMHVEIHGCAAMACMRNFTGALPWHAWGTSWVSCHGMHVKLRAYCLLLLRDLEIGLGHQVCVINTFTHWAASLIQKKLFLRNSALQAEPCHPRKSATQIVSMENDNNTQPSSGFHIVWRHAYIFGTHWSMKRILADKKLSLIHPCF